MKVIFRSILTAAMLATPAAATWAQSLDLNPGNSGGGRLPIATPEYGADQPSDPALTTGSRFSVEPNTPAYENPTVPGATGLSIVKGDKSTISLDRRGTVQQKTGGSAADAPG
jgi:hypothetical protein